MTKLIAAYFHVPFPLLRRHTVESLVADELFLKVLPRHLPPRRRFCLLVGTNGGHRVASLCLPSQLPRVLFGPCVQSVNDISTCSVRSS